MLPVIIAQILTCAHTPTVAKNLEMKVSWYPIIIVSTCALFYSRLTNLQLLFIKLVYLVPQTWEIFFLQTSVKQLGQDWRQHWTKVLKRKQRNYMRTNSLRRVNAFDEPRNFLSQHKYITKRASRVGDNPCRLTWKEKHY